jgi:hypothetical protein
MNTRAVAELREHMDAYVTEHVAIGRRSCPDIVYWAVRSAFAGQGPEDELWELALLAAGPAFAEHLAAQAAWPEMTDNDRVTAAFGALDRAGIVAREEFTSTLTDGRYEIRGEAAGRDDASGRQQPTAKRLPKQHSHGDGELECYCTPGDRRHAERRVGDRIHDGSKPRRGSEGRVTRPVEHRRAIRPLGDAELCDGGLEVQHADLKLNEQKRRAGDDVPNAMGIWRCRWPLPMPSPRIRQAYRNEGHRPDGRDLVAAVENACVDHQAP